MGDEKVVGKLVDGFVMLGKGAIWGTEGRPANCGRPGEGAIFPSVGMPTEAGTAPPGTDVVADGIAIPSEESRVVCGRDGTGTDCTIGTDADGT